MASSSKASNQPLFITYSRCPLCRQEKLDKACSMVTSQVDLYQLFLDRMNRWIKRNNYKAIELYQKFDKNGDGSLTYDEFKAGELYM